MHVTLRARPGLASLRQPVAFAGLEGALAAASRAGFRLLHYSVQSDHLHLIVEVDTPARLTRGMQGLAVRAARALNLVLGRRGGVWLERFHAHVLRAPREVRNALVYVLNNFRKHVPGARGLDPRSSARWFTGWKQAIGSLGTRAPVAPPRTWLAAVGWRRHGLLDVDEAPRTRLRR